MWKSINNIKLFPDSTPFTLNFEPSCIGIRQILIEIRTSEQYLNMKFCPTSNFWGYQICQQTAHQISRFHSHFQLNLKTEKPDFQSMHFARRWRNFRPWKILRYSLLPYRALHPTFLWVNDLQTRQWTITQKMTEQGRSDRDVVFTMILCVANIFRW